MAENTDNSNRPKPIGHEDLSNKWVGAGHLKAGDRLKKADGTLGTVVYVNTLAETRKMYNLEVQSAHTFFVGQNGWLTHNCGSIRITDTNKLTSRISNDSFFQRLAENMTDVTQRGADDLIEKFRNGNTNPGRGTRALGDGFFELRSTVGEARVIIKLTGNGKYDIVAKFQGHALGDNANNRLVGNIIERYNKSNQ